MGLSEAMLVVVSVLEGTFDNNKPFIMFIFNVLREVKVLVQVNFDSFKILFYFRYSKP